MSTTQERRYSIILYSDDVTVREAVKAALGTRIAPDMAEHEIREFATAAALRLFVDSKKPGSEKPIDLLFSMEKLSPKVASEWRGS